MNPILETIVIIASAILGSGGIVTVVVSHMLKKQAEQAAERARISDERYNERVEEEKKQFRLFLAGVSLIDSTTKELTEAGIINGELKREREDFRVCKSEYLQYINDRHASMAVQNRGR